VKSNEIQAGTVPGETWAQSTIEQPAQRLAVEPRRVAGNLGVLAEARTPAAVSVNLSLVYSGAGPAGQVGQGVNRFGRRTGHCLSISFGIRRILRVLQSSPGQFRGLENNSLFVVDGKGQKCHSVANVA